MIVKTLEIVSEEKEVVKDVVCNMCRNSCMESVGGSDHKEFCGVSIDVSGGYSSPVLQDMTRYQFDLCEKCLLEIMNKLTVPVEQS